MPREDVVIVTGAAQGIGAAVSRSLLDAGFRVCLTDLDASALREFSEELGAHYGSERVMAQVLDVRKAESVLQASQRLGEAWGRVDVLVNNAGVFSTAPVLELHETEFERILDVNLTGAFRVSQAFGRMMASQRRGKIIHVASIAARKGAPYSGHYAASKGGLLALAKTMAVELAPYNIQVNTVLPGYVETNMMGNHQEQMRKIAAWRTPVKRLGRPKEVAEVVCFLASSDSPFLTGTEIVIDGGHGIS